MASLRLGFFAALKCWVALGRPLAEYECDLPESVNASAMHEKETAVVVWRVKMDAALSNVSLKVKGSKIGGRGNDEILVFEQDNIGVVRR